MEGWEWNSFNLPCGAKPRKIRQPNPISSGNHTPIYINFEEVRSRKQVGPTELSVLTVLGLNTSTFRSPPREINVRNVIHTSFLFIECLRIITWREGSQTRVGSRLVWWCQGGKSTLINLLDSCGPGRRWERCELKARFLDCSNFPLWPVWSRIPEPPFHLRSEAGRAWEAQGLGETEGQRPQWSGRQTKSHIVHELTNRYPCRNGRHLSRPNEKSSKDDDLNQAERWGTNNKCNNKRRVKMRELIRIER